MNRVFQEGGEDEPTLSPTAQVEGFAAQQQGLRFRDNPYPAFGLLYTSWMDGWLAATIVEPQRQRLIRAEEFESEMRSQFFSFVGGSVCLLIVGIGLLLFLSGCASKKPYAPPPPPPPELVEAPVIEPPLADRVEPPVEANVVEELPPEIRTATKKFIKTGKADLIDYPKRNFVRYPYGLRQAWVYVAPFSVTSVEFEKGEVVDHEYGTWLTDTVRWKVGFVQYGVGENATQVMQIQPLDDFIAPNMTVDVTVGTNRRLYLIHAKYGTPRTIHAGFYYPQDTVRALNGQHGARAKEQKDALRHGFTVDLAAMRGTYQVNCNGARFCPKFVGHDGQRTAILLPEGLEALGLPSVMIERQGDKSLPNVHPIRGQGGTILLLDGLFDRGELVSGNDPHAPVVEMTRQQ